MSYVPQVKYVQKRQAWTESESDKKTIGCLSDHSRQGGNNTNENHEHNDDTAAEEVSLLETFYLG